MHQSAQKKKIKTKNQRPKDNGSATEKEIYVNSGTDCFWRQALEILHNGHVTLIDKAQRHLSN